MGRLLIIDTESIIKGVTAIFMNVLLLDNILGLLFLYLGLILL